MWWMEFHSKHAQLMLEVTLNDYPGTPDLIPQDFFLPVEHGESCLLRKTNQDCPLQEQNPGRNDCYSRRNIPANFYRCEIQIREVHTWMDVKKIEFPDVCFHCKLFFVPVLWISLKFLQDLRNERVKVRLSFDVDLYCQVPNMFTDPTYFRGRSQDFQ